MWHARRAPFRRFLRAGSMAFGLIVLGAAPVAFAQVTKSAGPASPTGTAIETGQGQTDPARPDRSRSDALDTPVITIAVPVGHVRVGPEFVEGEQGYMRRTAARDGMTVLEFSTTPFVPMLQLAGQSTGLGGSGGRPEELPASW